MRKFNLFTQSLIFALIYILFFHLIQFFFFKISMVSSLPDNDTLEQWDVGWYMKIIKYGYKYSAIGGETSAFFPLFPYMWKLLGVNTLFISLFNALLFAIGFAVLATVLKPSPQQKIIWITSPILFIMFVPYTEALFFLLASGSIYAIVNNKVYLGWLCLFLLSLNRPVAMILMPALLITELITNSKAHWLGALQVFLYRYFIPLAAGMLLFIWIQYYQTGVWFAFFKQEEMWGRKFEWPTFPLNSYTGPKFLWANAVALFIGFLALLQLIVRGLAWLIKNKPANDKVYWLALLYFTAILLQIIFFSPIWETGTTNVTDACRYLFATPFFFVFLQKVLEREYKAKDYLMIFLLSNIFWLLFASYNHVQYLLYFNVGTVLMLVYMLSKNKKMIWASYTVVIINFFLQVNYYQFYLGNIFPG